MLSEVVANVIRIIYLINATLSVYSVCRVISGEIAVTLVLAVLSCFEPVVHIYLFVALDDDISVFYQI